MQDYHLKNRRTRFVLRCIQKCSKKSRSCRREASTVCVGRVEPFKFMQIWYLTRLLALPSRVMTLKMCWDVSKVKVTSHATFRCSAWLFQMAGYIILTLICTYLITHLIYILSLVCGISIFIKMTEKHQDSFKKKQKKLTIPE